MDPSEGVARARLGAALFHLDRYEEASDLLKAGIDSREPGTEGDYFRTKFIQVQGSYANKNKSKGKWVKFVKGFPRALRACLVES